MTRRIGYVAGWLAITIVATVASTAAVSLVRADVIGQPTDVIVTAPPASLVAPTTSGATTPSTTVSEPSASATSTTTTTATTVASSEPTTTTSVAAATTTLPPTTTTTTAAATTGPFTFPVEGGTVTVSCHDDEISLGGAVPGLGYTIELEDSGPQKVRIDFQRDEIEIEVRIECEDGVPEIELEE